VKQLHGNAQNSSSRSSQRIHTRVQTYAGSRIGSRQVVRSFVRLGAAEADRFPGQDDYNVKVPRVSAPLQSSGRKPRLCLLYKPRQSPGGPEGRKGVHRLDRHRSPIVGTKDSKGLLSPLKRLPSLTAPSVRGHKTSLLVCKLVPQTSFPPGWSSASR